MKRIPLYIAALLMASANFTACSLDEVNMSSVDSGSYFKGETEYEQLINECYQAMRPLHRETIPMWYGTDMYTRQGDINQANRTPTNDYTVVGGDDVELLLFANHQNKHSFNTGRKHSRCIGIT